MEIKQQKEDRQVSTYPDLYSKLTNDVLKKMFREQDKLLSDFHEQLIIKKELSLSSIEDNLN